MAQNDKDLTAPCHDSLHTKQVRTVGSEASCCPSYHPRSTLPCLKTQIMRLASRCNWPWFRSSGSHSPSHAARRAAERGERLAESSSKSNCKCRQDTGGVESHGHLQLTICAQSATAHTGSPRARLRPEPVHQTRFRTLGSVQQPLDRTRPWGTAVTIAPNWSSPAAAPTACFASPPISLSTATAPACSADQSGASGIQHSLQSGQ